MVSVVLFEVGLRLVKKVYWNTNKTTKMLKKCIIDMLRKVIKWSHKKFSVSRKERKKGEKETKKEHN